jgi:hypothetical protein
VSLSTPLAALPATQQHIVRLLFYSGQATVHTLIWHARLYRGLGAEEGYRAVADLTKLGLLVTRDLKEPHPTRGGRRQLAALSRTGAVLFGLPGAEEASWIDPFDEPEERQAMCRQLALVHADYAAAGWRPVSGLRVWAALRSTLMHRPEPGRLDGTQTSLRGLLLRRANATIGTWAFVSQTGSVRLVLQASTQAETWRALRRLDAALLASVSSFAPLELLVVGPTELVEQRMVELVARWSKPPRPRVRRIKGQAAPQHIRTTSRAPVAISARSHIGYEWLPNPKTGSGQDLRMMASARQNVVTRWTPSITLQRAPVKLIKTRDGWRLHRAFAPPAR